MGTVEPFRTVSNTWPASRWRLVPYLLPLALLFILYAPVLRGWFREDDFAWLYMRQWMPEGSGWFYRLFSPQAQGTIRPGDRLFFTLLGGAFGRNPIPFHVVILATQCASIVLWMKVATRLTGSAWTGALAAVLWVSNAALADPMVWISGYNQVLLALFLLLAFLFKLKHLETGEGRYRALEWAAFLLGFGALEMNVIYPLLGAAYLAAYRRTGWKNVAAQAVVAALYTALHTVAAPMPNTGAYASAVDARMFLTFTRYWNLSLGPAEFARWFPAFEAWVPAASALLLLAVLFALVVGIRRREPAMAFGAAWFVIGLAPVLILPDHVSSYYLFMPVMGLALAGAYAALMFQSIWAKSAAIALLVIHAATNASAAVSIRDWTIDRTLRVRHFYDALDQIRARGGPACILLTGMNDDEFWGGYYGIRRYVPDLQDLYLAPGSERGITPIRDTFGTVADHAMPVTDARQRLAAGTCAAFDLRRTPPADVTPETLEKLRMQ